MSTIAKTGNDSLTIAGRIFKDFADGDNCVLTTQNQIANVKTGKNGNAIFSPNQTGQQGELVVKLIRASGDDKFLNGLLSLQEGNFAGSPTLFGEFVKRVGTDDNGEIINDTYILSGMMIGKQTEAKSNAEGDTEQSTVSWMFIIAKVKRVIT